MDGCLACKSCVGQCPIKVDVPAFRSRFLELYYGRYLRPPKDRLVASLERMLPWLARARTLSNAITSSSLGRGMPRQGGTFRVAHARRDRCPARARGPRCARSIGGSATRALSRRSATKSVVVVQDAFTSYYDASVVLDFFELIRRLGFSPWLAPFKPNGKPQHVLGFLDAFERTARANAELLNALAATGVPLVGIDPSMTLTYRAEYAKAIGREALAPSVALPQEWLASRIDALPQIRGR